MPIRLRVSFGNIRIDLSIGYSYNESKWDTARQRAKNNTSNENRQSAAEVNKAISAAIDLIDSYFQQKELEGKTPERDELKIFFDSEFKNKQQNNQTLADYFDNFMDIMKVKKSWSQNTIKKYLHLRNILVQNNISEISEAAATQYIEAEIEAGNRNPTILKNFRLFKVFAKWLLAEKITTYDISTYELRLKGSERNKKALVYLNWDELMQFWKFDFSKHPSLEMVRDAFCFCCFCGLRFSDAKNLKKADIQSGAINTNTLKTYDDLIIELNKYTTEILERYKDMESENALYMISNQKNNEYIKEACRMAGLNRPIKKVYYCGSSRKEITKPLWSWVSSHAARRTFVVQCIRKKIPIPVIMQWTGHASYESMKPYIDVVSDLKAEEMAKFDIE